MSLGKRLINTGAGAASTLAFAVNGDSLTSIDISDPSNIVELDTFTGAGMVECFSVSVNPTNFTAYVLSRTSDNVTVVDISDPSNMSELDSLTDGVTFNRGYKSDIDVENNVLYVTSSISGGLGSVDISNPSNISVLDFASGTDLNGLTLDLTNQIAYAGSGTLCSYNISNPSNLIKLDESVYFDSIYSFVIDVENNAVYAGDGGSGGNLIHSINVSNPSNISLYSTFVPNTNRTRNLAIDTINKVLYACSQSSDQLAAVNISNPSSLSLYSNFSSANSSGQNGIAVDVNSDRLYLGAAGGILSLDVSNPSSIIELDFITLTNSTPRDIVLL